MKAEDRVLAGTFAVTGAGSGIGASAARRLKSLGADVILLDRDGDAAQRVAKEIDADWRALDVSDEEQVAAVFSHIGPLSGLVNAAGIIGIEPLASMTLSEWRRVISVNLDGTFLCLQAAARSMISAGTGGAIVNVASVNSQFSHRGLGAYSASKGAVVALTRTAALEFMPSGIRVNAVSPGFVATGMSAADVANPAFISRYLATTAPERIAQPEDIAAAICMLLGDGARWINGQTIAVDGGLSLRVEPTFSDDADWTRESLRQRYEA